MRTDRTDRTDRTVTPGPTLVVAGDADAVAQVAADLLVDALRRALLDRDRAVLALSGGRTPHAMYDCLATADLDWRRVHVVQVDERQAEDGDPDRNWGAIRSLLVEPTGALGHPMPVVSGPLEAMAEVYADELAGLCDGVVDALHLGLGDDGHTASLVPGDPVMSQVAVDVAATGVYEGRRRMTFTAPALDRAQRIVWQVVGEGKRPALGRLLAGGGSDPAALVRRAPEVFVVADEAASG